MEHSGRPWNTWNLLEHSMKLLCEKVYNELTHSSKGERPPLPLVPPKGHYLIPYSPVILHHLFPIPLLSISPQELCG